MIDRVSWDSDFFNIEVGKLIVGEDSLIDSEKFIIQAEKFKLVYVFSNNLLEKSYLKHVDTQIVFSKTLKLEKPKIDLSSIITPLEITDEIVKLVYSAGHLSRFKQDENFKNKEFERLYLKWIMNAFEDIQNSRVFAEFYDDKIIGFISITISKDKARIGLIAVDDGYQGMNTGSKLISVAEEFCLQNNIFIIEVATQAQNEKACGFYVKNGYKIISSTNVYHYWN